MKRLSDVLMVARGLVELCRYDVRHGLLAIDNVESHLGAPVATAPVSDAGLESRLCEAMALAACLYWKPVQCLHRSICTVRLLRSRGLSARLVIGFRAEPFVSHAWVEVSGRIVNDSPAYRERLRVLYTA